jgi:di/tricarboxylate transporter
MSEMIEAVFGYACEGIVLAIVVLLAAGMLAAGAAVVALFSGAPRRRIPWASMPWIWGLLVVFGVGLGIL